MKTRAAIHLRTLYAATVIATTILCQAQEPGNRGPAIQSEKRYSDQKLGIAFDVPKAVNLYTKENPGPLAPQISSTSPLYLVNPEFTEENVNVKVTDGVSDSDLTDMKRMFDRNPNLSLPEYKRVSVTVIKIGKNKDITAVEHLFMMKGNIMGKLRQVTFVHGGRGFTFTCATAVERFDKANREFFDPLFATLELHEVK